MLSPWETVDAASAQPLPLPPQGAASGHCAEVPLPQPASPDDEGCCEDMRLHCLVNINCLAPLLTIDSSTALGSRVIDQEAGTITIHHGPIEAVNWPAMTMPFQAPEELLSAVQVGDKVNFAFKSAGSGGKLTAISKR